MLPRKSNRDGKGNRRRAALLVDYAHMSLERAERGGEVPAHLKYHIERAQEELALLSNGLREE